MIQMLSSNKRDQVGFMNPILEKSEEPYLYIVYSYKGIQNDLMLPESVPLQLPIIP